MPAGLLNSGWLFTFQTAGSYSDTPGWATHIKLHMYIFVSLVAKFTSASIFAPVPEHSYHLEKTHEIEPQL